MSVAMDPFSLTPSLERDIPYLTPSSNPAASLEALPALIILDVMLKLQNLPSLRRPRLASRDFHDVAKCYPRQLRLAYEHEITAREPGSRGPWLKKHFNYSILPEQSPWLPHYDESLFQGLSYALLYCQALVPCTSISCS